MSPAGVWTEGQSTAWSRRAVVVGAAMFTPGVLFVLVFNSILLANLDEVAYDTTLVLIFFGLFVGTTTACVAIFAAGLGSKNWARLARAVVAAGALVFVFELLRPLTVAAAGIRGAFGIELVAVVVVAALVLKPSLRSIFLVLAVVAPVQITSAVYQHVTTVAGTTASRQAQRVARLRLEPVGLISDPRPVFRWPEFGAGHRYEIEVVDDVTGVAVVREGVDGNRHRLAADLEAGHQYRWRFRTLPNGEPDRFRGWVRFRLSDARLSPHPEGGEALGASTAPMDTPNVYLVVLDAYQSESYEYLRDTRPELTELPVTFFPQFRVSSGKTWSSLTEMLRGEHYLPDHQIEEWRVAAPAEGLLGDLFRHGVQVHQYPYYRNDCYEFAVACRDTVRSKKEFAGRSHSIAIVDLWFLNTMPTTVRRTILGDAAAADAASWDYGFSITDLLLGETEGPAVSHNAYYSLKQFERVLDEETRRPDSGQLVFAHIMLPHSPYVVGADCEYLGQVGEDDDVIDRLLDQTTCANHLLGSLFDRLEELGRLDSSLVMVISDHGTFWRPTDDERLQPYLSLEATIPFLDVDEVDSATWSSDMLEVRSSALMLVKFPRQREWQSSAQPVQMIDVAPTIAAHFGAPVEHYAGLPIDQIGPNMERETLFYGFNKIPRAGAPAVMSIYRRNGDGDWLYSHDIETLQ